MRDSEVIYGLITVIQIAIAIARVVGLVETSWWIILMPTWIMFFGTVAVMVVELIMAAKDRY